MSKKIPDAWDDDWESLADKPTTTEIAASPTPASAPKLTKSQKRAQHLEQQKQLWDSAENPARNHWLESQGVVPLKQEFKPRVTLLSRKPVAPTIAKKDASDGVAKLSLQDDGEEGDSEEEDRKRREAEMEERQRVAKIQREEKQRKYAEARERIMGSPSTTNAAQQPPRDSSHARKGTDARAKVNGSRNSQPTSSADQSPARPASRTSGGGQQGLFDPDDMGRRLPRREREGNATPTKEELPSRQPRGPDGGGRGGFGFAARGGGAVA